MSIRTKLTIIMLAIGLMPMVAVGLIAFSATRAELSNKTDEQLASVITNQLGKINALLEAHEEQATELANNFDLQSALKAYVGGNQATASDALHTILHDRQVATPEIQALSVAGLDGTIISSTLDATIGKKLATADNYVPDGQESNTTVQQDSRDGLDKLHITIRLSINKKASGYLNLVFRIDDLTAVIQDYTGLGTTGETIIAAKDSSGHVISLFPLRFNTDAALKANLDSLQLFSQNQALYNQTADYRGQQVIVTAKSINFADWVIATKIDTSEALAPINQLGASLLITVIISSAAMVALSFYFARTYTRPILQVAAVADQYGRGDFTARADIKRSDEIGALAQSINVTGNSLQDFVSRLESQRNRLEIILNNTTESILAINQHNKILIANAAVAELSKAATEGIVGQDISEVFSWKQGIQTFAIDYTKKGTNTYPNLEYTDTAGAVHYVKLLVSRLTGEQDPEAPQVIVTIHDETKSRDLDKMKVDFVSMAAHELRTPLAAIRGYVELVNFKEGENVAPDIKNYLQQALKSTAELGSLIDNLLGVTRIERGTLTLHPEKVDIAADVQQAVRNASFTSNDKRIALSYDGPTSGCYVIADQISLHEVINNLISNAIKYTNAGGSVSVLLGREGTHYVIHFKDTGIGIPKESIQNLFTKFYRVHGGLNSGSTGTGLGLFIAKSIIERHGGTITVESEAGAGSTFTVTIPILDEAKLASLQAAQHKTDVASKGNRGWTTKNITR